VLSLFFLTLIVINAPFSMTTLIGQWGDQPSKLSSVLQHRMIGAQGDDVISVIIKLQGVDLREVKSELVIDRLKTQAAWSQRYLLEYLGDEENARVLNTFWLTNSILANVTVKTLNKIASLDVVKKVFENFKIKIPQPLNKFDDFGSSSIDVTWGLDRIDVPQVWGMGYNGSGVRVCVLDTGVEISHQDLVGKMWTDNLTDPTFPGGWIEFDWSGNVIQSSTPYDSDGHGTHTSGTVLGGNQSGLAIGVAPGAWLMHGLILPGGSGSFTQCIAGMQWAIDPFDQYGNPAGEKADVVSMSWGASGHHDEMIEPIKNMRAARVVPIASIGNYGEGNTGSPGNVFESIAIGAIDAFDSVAGFSSGEEIVWSASHSELYIKPDFSAPGVNVYSSVPFSGWEFWSGTSMAAPHVAGTVALMLDANTNLTIEDVFEVLKISVEDLGDIGQDIRFGWGVINTYKAVNLSISNCGVEGYITDANTSQPLDWPAQVTVAGVSWGNINTGIDGQYKIWLYPDNYTITANAFGYLGLNTSVEVIENQWSEINFTLLPTPRGIIVGAVTDLADQLTIANATISLPGKPLNPVFTNGTGYFRFEVPLGIYIVDFWAWGYKPTIVPNVAILENQTTIIDAELETTIRVAVLGDYRSQTTNLLMRNISAHERDWDVIQEISDYDVIIVNVPTDPGEQVFLNLIAAADQLGVSLIFTNTYPGPWSPYGISLLQRYSGDPEGSYFAYWSGVVYYEVTEPHPIFNGWNIGDRIAIINGGDDDFAWFYQYSGTIIADISSESLGPLGYGVAYGFRANGGVHLLLSGLSQSEYTNINNAWTGDAMRIFRNAVVWASEPFTLRPPSVSINPDNGLTGSKVIVNGSGFATKSDITIKFDDMPIATTKADGNGSFTAAFNVPLAEAGVHMIKVLDDYNTLVSTTYTVTASSVEMNVLAIEVDVGSIYWRGEVAQFFALTTLNGIPINVTRLDARIYKPDRTSETLSYTQEGPGIYLMTFAVPLDALNGTYTLRVDAEVNGVNGASIGSFLVSSTLTAWNATLLAMEHNLAIVQTDIGIIKISFTDVRATLDSLQDDIAILQTNIGLIKTDIASLELLIESVNTSLIEIRNGIAVLHTDVGQFAVNLTLTNAVIAELRDEVAVVSTDVGQIEVELAYARSIIESSNTTLIGIEGNVATIETEIGEIRGLITSIQDDVATVETDLGQIRVGLQTSFAGSSNFPQMSITQIMVSIFVGWIIIVALILLMSHVAFRPKTLS
jgi:subtilisin family serine protease